MEPKSVIAYQHICPDRTKKNGAGHPAHVIRKIGFIVNPTAVLEKKFICPLCKLEYVAGVVTLAFEIPKPTEIK